MQKYAPAIAAIVLGLTFLPATGLLAQNNREAQRLSPDDTLWHFLKKALASSDGIQYFDQNLKGVELPVLAGRVVFATPEDQPSVLVLAMYDGVQPEVTVRLKHENQTEDHMPGPVTASSLIRFEGVGVSFVQEPFMLTFDVYTNRR